MVKPKDFRIPFTRECPSVVLEDRVLFIPPLAGLHAFTMPSWEDPSLFGNTHPVQVEFCSGNGTWIIEKAHENPHLNWVAVEIRFDRVRKIWSKAKNEGIQNLVIVFGDARLFAHHYVANQSISALYINFPDPWPKKRHIKHRIISDPLFVDAHSMLSSLGSFIFVTDDEDYSTYFLEHANRFSEQFTLSSHKCAPPDDYGTSFFDELFRSQGKSILYHEVLRKP